MIVFNDPYVSGAEEANIREVFGSKYFCGNGDFTRRCEATLQELHGAAAVLLTSSCSAALEICAQLLQLEPGDEVILPSFTHVGTATAFARLGATLVWADITPGTKNLDPDHLASLFTSRTRAVVAVHYCGVASGLERITELCARHGAVLIEDNAAGLGAAYRGRPLGTFGDVSTLSFHQTKNIHCGEGGALVLNNPRLVEAAATMRDRGTDRKAFEQHKVKAYTWQAPGSNYYMSELQAAFLAAQLAALLQVTQTRRALFARYHAGLQGALPAADLPLLPAESEHNGHAFYILCASQEQRRRLIAALHEADVQSAFHYQPLHAAPYWNGAYDHLRLPVTTSAAQRLLRLPMHMSLTMEQVDRICERVVAFFGEDGR